MNLIYSATWVNLILSSETNVSEITIIWLLLKHSFKYVILDVQEASIEYYSPGHIHYAINISYLHFFCDCSTHYSTCWRHHHVCYTEETCLHNFLVILKPNLLFQSVPRETLIYNRNSEVCNEIYVCSSGKIIATHLQDWSFNPMRHRVKTWGEYEASILRTSGLSLYCQSPS